MRSNSLERFLDPMAFLEGYRHGRCEAQFDIGLLIRSGSAVHVYQFRANLHHTSSLGQLDSVGREVLNLHQRCVELHVPGKGKLELTVLVSTRELGQDGEWVGGGIVGPLSVRLVVLDIRSELSVHPGSRWFTFPSNPASA